MDEKQLNDRRMAPLRPRVGISSEATRDIAAALTALLADVFALYLKTKNFHWHVAGPHFPSYHQMFDAHGDELFAMTDPLAERVRKIGGATLRSIAHIARLQRVLDNDADYVGSHEMLAELCEDNGALAGRLRIARTLCDEAGDAASASLIENWLDETERRVWFLYESTQKSS